MVNQLDSQRKFSCLGTRVGKLQDLSNKVGESLICPFDGLFTIHRRGIILIVPKIRAKGL
jgi:hypothetical protein